jgi:hypothetical protein
VLARDMVKVNWVVPESPSYLTASFMAMSKTDGVNWEKSSLRIVLLALAFD